MQPMCQYESRKSFKKGTSLVQSIELLVIAFSLLVQLCTTTTSIQPASSPASRKLTENADTAVTTGLTTPALMMIAGSVAMLALALKWTVESFFFTWMLSTECEKVIKDLQNATRLQKKLKRAVEIEVPEMKRLS